MRARKFAPYNQAFRLDGRKHPMTFRTILFDVTAGAARLTLNRPDKLNSFTGLMHEEIRAALTDLESRQDMRVLLITGAGRGFCAGQDLADPSFADVDNLDAAETLERNYNPLLLRLRRLPMPVVCAVNGVAAGAGANFALAADLVIATQSASFLQAFSRIALIPDAGGTYVLPRLAGMARAMAWSMLAEPVSAEQAQATGLIWKCVPDDNFVIEVDALVQRLALAPTRALALIKKALYASIDNDYPTQLKLEANLQREAGQSADFREGVKAFLEKRPARFTGR